jgi:chitin synthase
MDYPNERRPPRATRPKSTQPPSSQSHSHSHSPSPALPEQQQYAYSQPTEQYQNLASPRNANVSFFGTERGDRHSQLDSQRQQRGPVGGLGSAYQPQAGGFGADAEGGEFDSGRVGRKKSLVRPDREKIEPGHRQWHYRNRVAQIEEEGHGRVGIMPSCESSALSQMGPQC